MKRIIAVAVALLAFGIYNQGATATHLTSVTIGPDPVLVVAGGTASFSGTVDGTAGFSDNYATSSTISGEPAGSTISLSTSGTPQGAAQPYAYTLDIGVPAGAAPGSYTITITTCFTHDFFTDDLCRSASATLFVLAGACPTGDSWSVQQALGSADPFDKNGDGWICTKNIPNANGEGNSANRNGAAGVGHVDGHNHKDNNN